MDDKARNDNWDRYKPESPMYRQGCTAKNASNETNQFTQ